MPDKEVILTAVTDRSQLELLAKELGKEGYEIVSAASLPELVDAIQKEGKIKLALVDVSAFDHSIWEQMEELHKARVPFLVMSNQRSPSVQRDSIKHGAAGLFTKGLSIKQLMEHIHTLLGRRI
ncbi:MAG: response regulator [Dehalococcoidales bacterium]|nr:response regulator [Dehalococcoidales bacterium]